MPSSRVRERVARKTKRGKMGDNGTYKKKFELLRKRLASEVALLQEVRKEKVLADLDLSEAWEAYYETGGAVQHAQARQSEFEKREVNQKDLVVRLKRESAVLKRKIAPSTALHGSKKN